MEGCDDIGIVGVVFWVWGVEADVRSDTRVLVDVDWE